MKGVNISSYSTPVGLFRCIEIQEEKSVRLVLTGKCNLACEFCAYKKKPFISPEVPFDNFEDMYPSEDLKVLLRKLKDTLHYNIAHFTGGEPTLSPYIISLAQICKSIGYNVNMTTNLKNMIIIEKLIERSLLKEITFSFHSSSTHFETIQKHNVAKCKEINSEIIFKSNIIVGPYSDINKTKDFINWCWDNKIIPRVQRDRSNNRIKQSTYKTLSLLEHLKVNPVKVIIKVPGATEICEFKNKYGNIIHIKVFNNNFRLGEICKQCNINKCNKGLSSIRIYTSGGLCKLCLCTKIDKDYANPTAEGFFTSPAFKEILTYKENKELYFKKFCNQKNFQ